MGAVEGILGWAFTADKLEERPEINLLRTCGKCYTSNKNNYSNA